MRGRPKPQGSKTIGRRGRSGRPIILEGRDSAQRDAIKEWRALVAAETTLRMLQLRRDGAFRGPVSVHILFVFDRPKSTRAGHRWRSTMPDIDKLSRAVLDALKTGGAIGDDNQVAELVARKVLSYSDEAEGAVIRITQLDHAEAPTSVADALPAPNTPANPPRGPQRAQNARSTR